MSANGVADAVLAREAQHGDVASLGVLLERHRARLYAAAVSFVGHGPRAEDAVHDTFLIALRRIDELRDPAAARAWLLRILSNVCLAERRRPQPEPTGELGSETEARRIGVDEAIERSALRDWVWAALGRLPEPLRLVIVLRHFTNASSYEAIADLCGVPVGTVRSRLSAARAKLADELRHTAAAEHPDGRRRERRALQEAAAMSAFERTGDRGQLQDTFATDVRFLLADRVERQGLDLLASMLAAEFDDGVRLRPVRLIAGEDIVVMEMRRDSPPEQPLRCPPALTSVHFHDGGTTDRIVNYHAPGA